MPKLAIISDTHFDRVDPPDIDASRLPDFDVLIHAGDLAERGKDRALAWLRRLAGPDRPAVFCPGNHDLYAVEDDWKDAPLGERVADLTRLAAGHGVAVLAPGASVEAAGTTIHGSTLWSDWRLAGVWLAEPDAGRIDLDRASLEILPSVRAIAVPDFSWLKDRYGGAWDVWSCAAEHAVHLAALDRSLAAHALRTIDAPSPAVVVTHHAPHPISVEGYREAPIPRWAPGFYASDLTWFIGRHRPALWVHGHVHVPVDYRVADTRIVSNPCPHIVALEVVEV